MRYFAGQGKSLGTLASFCTDSGVPLGPVGENGGYIAERFHIVDAGRFVPQARLSRIRRFGGRQAPTALNRSHQGRFLPAHERTRSLNDTQLEPRPAPRIARSEESLGAAERRGLCGVAGVSILRRTLECYSAHG